MWYGRDLLLVYMIAGTSVCGRLKVIPVQSTAAIRHRQKLQWLSAVILTVKCMHCVQLHQACGAGTQKR